MSEEIVVDCLYNKYKFNGQTNTLGTLSWGRKFTNGPLTNSGTTANATLTVNLIGFTSKYGNFWSPVTTVADHSAANYRYMLRSKNADGTANISKIQDCHPIVNQKVLLFYPKVANAADDPFTYGKEGKNDSFGLPTLAQWEIMTSALCNLEERQLDFQAEFSLDPVRTVSSNTEKGTRDDYYASRLYWAIVDYKWLYADVDADQSIIEPVGDELVSLQPADFKKLTWKCTRNTGEFQCERPEIFGGSSIETQKEWANNAWIGYDKNTGKKITASMGAGFAGSLTSTDFYTREQIAAKDLVFDSLNEICDKNQAAKYGVVLTKLDTAGRFRIKFSIDKEGYIILYKNKGELDATWGGQYATWETEKNRHSAGITDQFVVDDCKKNDYIWVVYIPKDENVRGHMKIESSVIDIER